MDINNVELTKLNKKQLIELINKQEEKLSINEECYDLLRIDTLRS